MYTLYLRLKSQTYNRLSSELNCTAQHNHTDWGRSLLYFNKLHVSILMCPYLALYNSMQQEIIQ